MSAAAFDDVLAGGRGEDGALVFESGEPARPAVFVPFPGDLDPRVQSALIGAGLGAGLAVIGAGVGIGRIGGSVADGMARQPENSARIQTGGLIFAALVEGVALFVAVIALLMQGKITF